MSALKSLRRRSLATTALPRYAATALLLSIAAQACSEPSAPSSIPAPETLAFAKAPSEPTTTWLIPTEAAGLALKSDGKYVSNGYSAYAHGVCGVSTVIHTNGSGDATIKTGAPKKGCDRVFTVTYPDGVSESFKSFNNLQQLHTDATSIAVGTTVERRLAINPGVLGSPSRCGRIIFGDNGEVGAGSHKLLVTRVDAKTWDIASQLLNNQALCENTGELYSMPVSFRIVSN